MRPDCSPLIFDQETVFYCCCLCENCTTYLQSTSVLFIISQLDPYSPFVY
ncbi:hypothetical protein Hanom_Chr16g01522371 [Helianthus anomalus]